MGRAAEPRSAVGLLAVAKRKHTQRKQTAIPVLTVAERNLILDWCAASGASQTGFTCSARGPLGPRPSTKETFCPSCRSSYCTPSRPDEWKKMSFPPGSAINPNPLSVSFLMVPSGITRPFVVEPLVAMSPA